MLIWIIDEEWKDYDVEKEVLEAKYPGVEIRHSTYDYEKDLKEFGYRADGILAQVYASIPKVLLIAWKTAKALLCMAAVMIASMSLPHGLKIFL